MKKFIIAFSINLILGFLISYIVPIWFIAILITFLTAFFINVNLSKSLLSGFISIGLIWFIYGYYLSFNNNDLLLNKISNIFNANKLIIYIVLFLLGGIIGLLGSLCGFFTKNLSKKKKNEI